MKAAYYCTRAMMTCGVTLLVLAGTTPIPAPASTPTAFRMAGLAKAPPVPGGFRLEASNGYSLIALGIPAHEGQPATIELFVNGQHQGVSYSAPAIVTETSIQANLGELGEISVTFHPSGKPTKVRPKCGGRPVSFDSGRYEGRIDFHGEEGYTEVETTSVPGNIDFFLGIFCSSISGRSSGPLLPGAELHVRNPQLGPELTVEKNRPRAPTRFEVSDSEYHSGIAIDRFTSSFAPAGAFRYDRRLRTAILHPPAPFAGTARFDHSAKPSSRWRGDLTVDMPGRANMPLTGADLRARLIHAEWRYGG
jgi:hypothetical protein